MGPHALWCHLRVAHGFADFFLFHWPRPAVVVLSAALLFGGSHDFSCGALGRTNFLGIALVLTITPGGRVPARLNVALPLGAVGCWAGDEVPGF